MSNKMCEHGYTLPCPTCLQARIDALEALKERLRGQLQNCVNHLEHAKRNGYPKGKYDACIESANCALYESLLEAADE